MAAVKKLAKASAATDVESADSLGRVELVAGDGEEVYAEGVDVYRDFSCRLHGVGVEVDVVLCGYFADLVERLDSTEFIVGVHDGDEQSFRTDGLAQFFEVNEAIRIDGEVGHGRAFFFQSLAGI